MTPEIQTPKTQQSAPENMEQPTESHDELDLSCAEDLGLFLESAEDVYTDAAAFKKFAQAESYRSLSFDDVKGEEIFDTLFSVLQTLQQQILEVEEQVVVKMQVVTDAQVCSMQGLYNNLILLRNLVRDTYVDSINVSLRSMTATDAHHREKGEEVHLPRVDVGVRDTPHIKLPAVVMEQAQEGDERDLYNRSTSTVMKIAPDAPEHTIKIDVAKNTTARIREQAAASVEYAQQPVPVVTEPIVERPLESDRAPLAAAERRDVINTAIPKMTHHVLPVKSELVADSLTRRYLSDPTYQAFIADYYSSPEAFERMLDTTITEIEARTSDIFERWLREEQKSPFVLLAPVSVVKVLEISQNRHCRENILAEKIKYETFATWVDLIPEMQAVVGIDSSMTFGELFARYMIESEMFYQKQKSIR